MVSEEAGGIIGPLSVRSIELANEHDLMTFHREKVAKDGYDTEGYGWLYNQVPSHEWSIFGSRRRDRDQVIKEEQGQ